MPTGNFKVEADHKRGGYSVWEFCDNGVELFRRGDFQTEQAALDWVGTLPEFNSLHGQAA